MYNTVRLHDNTVQNLIAQTVEKAHTFCYISQLNWLASTATSL